MAAISWKTGAPGDWSTPTDWSTNAIPGAADDATINAANTYIVTVAAAEAAHSLTLNAAGGTLEVENRLNIGTTLAATAGTLQIDAAGTLNGGTVVTGGAGFVFAGGTLNAETWQGPLILAGANASLTGTGGLTLTATGGSGPGELDLTGTNAVFSVFGGFDASGSLGALAALNITGQGAGMHTSGITTLDNATLTIGNVAGAIAGDADSLTMDNNSTLTFGAGLNLIGVGTGTASVNYPSYWNTSGVMNNLGTMTAAAAGATLLVQTVPGYGGDMIFTNSGTMAASNGGTLSVRTGNFNDLGVISVGANSTALLSGKGTFGTAAAVGIGAGGTVHLLGTYSIAGTLAPTGAGTFELDNTGTLNLGTIAVGAPMLFAGGTLNGVTYEGPLVLGGTSASATAINGLVLTGSGGKGPGELDLTGTNSVMTLVNGVNAGGSAGTLAAINITGPGATLYAQGTATLDDAVVTVGNVGGAVAGGANALYLQGPGTLTLDSGLSLADAGTGTVAVGFQPTYYNQAGTLISNGTMTAGAPGTTLLIQRNGGPGGDSFNFIDNGRLAASNGGTLTIQADNFTDNGTISVGASSVAQLYGAGQFGTAAAIGIGAGGVAHLFGNYSIAGTLAPSGAGSFELDNTGTLNLGTVAATAAMLFAGGTLSGVTYEGPLVLGGTSASATAINGLTLTGAGGTGPGELDLTGTNAVMSVVNGFNAGGSSGTPAAINITGHGATLYTSGTTTLDNAVVTIGNTGGAISGGADTLAVQGPSTLTLGAGLNLIDAGAGTASVVFQPTYYSQPGTLINNGTMTAGANGATLLVQRVPAYSGDTFTFINNGQLAAANGGTLTIQPDSFADNGAINVGTSSVANLDGAGLFGTAAAIGIGAAGVVHLLGSYGIAGTIAPSGAGTFELDSSGTLNAGTVAATAAVLFAGGTLSGVTYEGPMVLGGTSASATATNGLTLTGTGGTRPGTLALTGTNAVLSLVNGFSSGGTPGTLATIDVTGHGATLYTSGTTTLDNALLTIGNAGGAVSGGADALYLQGSSTLTLGSGLSLADAGTGTVSVGFQPTYYSQTSTLVNNGTMTAGATATTLLVQRVPAYSGDSFTFINNGRLAAANGGTLTIQPDNFVDNGTISVGASSVAQLYGAGLFGTAAAIGIGAGGVARLLGSYSIAGTLAPSGAGTFELDSSGTLNTGTIAATAAMLFAGGTLSGVAYEGPLVLGGTNSSVTAINGLALTGAAGTGAGELDLTGTNAVLNLVNGFSSGGAPGAVAAINITGHGATLYTSGTTTLDNAVVTIGGPGGAIPGGADALYVQGSSTLTLGSGLNLADAGAGTVSVGMLPTYYSQVATIINAGTMTAGAPGTTLLVQRVPAYSGDSLTFINNGKLAASNGGTLTIQPDTFTDNGTISVGASSVANLYGAGMFGTAAAIDIAAGGVAHLFGSYNIAGTLATTGAGTFELDTSGTLNGGTIGAGGSVLFAGGTVSGVTYEGPMVLGGASTTVTAINGLSLTGANGTGPGSLALTGTNAALNLINGLNTGGTAGNLASLAVTGHGATLFTSGTTTLDNATLTIGNAAAEVAGNADSLVVLGPSSLTFGKGLDLIGVGAGTATVNGVPTNYSQTLVLTNEGTINAATSGATLLFQRSPSYALVELLTNNGTMEATNGGTLAIQTDTLISNGTIDIGANSTGVISPLNGFANHGVLDVRSGAIATITGPLISDVGSMVIGSGGELILNAASVVSTQTVAFNNIGTPGPISTLKLGNPAAFSGTIDGFTTPGDTLELVGQTVTGASITGSTLNVTLSAGGAMAFNLADTPASTQLLASGDSVRVAVGPTITGTKSGQTLTDITTIDPFAGVTIGDIAVGQTETVTVTLSAASNGTLSGLTGSYDPSTGVYTDIGTPDEVTAALRSEVFTPTAHEVAPGQTVTTTFTIHVIDTATVSATDNESSTLATATSAPRTLNWSGAKDTVFSNAQNWIDTTFKHSPALWAPNNTDTAEFIAAGGTITGAGTVAAIEVGGTGRWTVNAAGALSSVNGITVGLGGEGDLLISGGASINGLGAIDTVTGTVGSSAEITVDGASSTWHSAGELIAGTSGSGNVNVTNGATLNAAATASLPAMVLGASADATGALDVSASQVSLSGQLDVGLAGRGTLTIENKGTLRTGGAAVAPAQGFDLGVSAGAAGQATVTGAKSTLSNTGAFIVGDAGLGGLSIQGGGTVITTPGTVGGLAGMVIGNSASAAGSSVNVSGIGSRLDVAGLLEIGLAGSGGLLIYGGATVTAGSLDAGISATAVGQIGVSGAGTTLRVTGAATVADDGTGVLSVLNGATFSADSLTIGSLGDSSGALVVSGEGSVVNVTGALNIGTALGIGDLTVGPGAAVHAAVVNLQGQVVLEGGLLDPVLLPINQGQTDGGFGTLEADNFVLEGVLQAGGVKASQKLLVVQGTVIGGGTLTVNGTAMPSSAAGELRINAGGTLELTGAVLNAATTTVSDGQTPEGAYTVNNGVVDVTFADSAGVLKLDDIAEFAGTIAAYQAGDSFVITGGRLSDMAVSNGNTLTVLDSGAASGIDRIMFGAPVAADGFRIVNGDTILAITPPRVEGSIIGLAGHGGNPLGLADIGFITSGDIPLEKGTLVDVSSGGASAATGTAPAATSVGAGNDFDQASGVPAGGHDGAPFADLNQPSSLAPGATPEAGSLGEMLRYAQSLVVPADMLPGSSARWAPPRWASFGDGQWSYAGAVADAGALKSDLVMGTPQRTAWGAG